MVERPILMSGPLVVAALGGRKTQTRRLLAGQPAADWRIDGDPNTSAIRMDTPGPVVRCPFGAPGDRLYVREAWRPWIRGYSSHVQYRADGKRGDSLGPDASNAAMEWCEKRGGHWDDGRAANPDDARWFPSIHMPRWASRLSLDVLSVRVERVQDITEEDARAEGLPPNSVDLDKWEPLLDGWLTPVGLANAERGRDCEDDGTVGGVPAYVFTAREAFRAWWDHLSPAGARWEDNPWVWAVTFARVSP